MYFKSIEIQNFKGIINQKIVLHQGMNILLGENGVGKTTILEAMTVALGDYFGGIIGVSKKGILQQQVRFNTHPTGQASATVEYCTPTVISSEFHLNPFIAPGRVVRENETSQSRTKFYGKVVSAYAQHLTNDVNSILPVLCYFSTQRVAQSKREDFGAAGKNNLNDRRCGYIGCLDDSPDRKALEAWCLKMEQTGFKKNSLIPEYEIFKSITAKFMKTMNELESEPQIYYSRVFNDMVYTEKGVETPVKYLSAGYQSLLWIVMTVAFRLCQLNPNITDYKEVPGIVMIDEIDMHLHPQWQWRILSALTTTFPAFQFIVTTHAPIVLSSCKNGNLVSIDHDQTVSYLPDAYAFSVDDILELRQRSESVPKKLKELYIEFDRSLTSEDYSAAREKLEEMKANFGKDNSEVKKAAFELGME